MQFKLYHLYFMLAVMVTVMTSGASAHASINSATQIISQKQSSLMDALCASGGSTIYSCNNLNIQNQNNEGNNVAAQEDNDDGYYGKGNDDNDGNSATQVISQSQFSKQNSQVVSGDDTIGSGNNFNFQNQENSGNNVAAQEDNDDNDDGYYGKGNDDNDGNSATQVISQSQSSDQDSNCVSGGSTSNSCNNFNSQTQNNYGSNVLLQR